MKRIYSKFTALTMAAFLFSIAIPGMAIGSPEPETTVGNIVIGTGAVSGGGDQNTAVGASVQIVNGQGNVVEGFGAMSVGGDGNTAIGVNAQAVNGNYNKAIGFGAIAGGGSYNTAIGRGTIAAYGDANTAVGSGAFAGSTHMNTAIGFNAAAYGGSSVAVGAFSVAKDPDTVSVGNADYNYQRRIVNVAPGINDTDAVNMSQLRGLDSRVNRLGATAFAFSALAPLSYDPKDPTHYSAGIGSYNGKQAVALGVFHYTKETVMINAAFGISDDGWEKSGRMGITWRTGKGKAKPAAQPASVVVSTGSNEPSTATASTATGFDKTVEMIINTKVDDDFSDM